MAESLALERLISVFRSLALPSRVFGVITLGSAEPSYGFRSDNLLTEHQARRKFSDLTILKHNARRITTPE